MDGFVLAAVAVLAMMTGFWAGRSVQWQLVDLEDVTESMEGSRPEQPVEKERMSVYKRREKTGNYRRISLSKEIGSPASGEVTSFVEDGRPMVRIQPEQGKMYAPASGRIMRLYPMGSAMLLRTDFGAEILLRAGGHVDEMCSMYYRCRVMEHEIVRKGSLLLEYDMEGLQAEGADTDVLMSLQNGADPESVSVLPYTHAKAGETILRM